MRVTQSTDQMACWDGLSQDEESNAARDITLAAQCPAVRASRRSRPRLSSIAQLTCVPWTSWSWAVFAYCWKLVSLPSRNFNTWQI